MGKLIYDISKLVAFIVLNLLAELIFIHWGNELLGLIDISIFLSVIPYDGRDNIINMFLTLAGAIAFIFFAHYVLGGTGFRKIGITLKGQGRFVGLGLGLVLLLVLPYLVFIYLLGYGITLNPNFSGLYMLLGLLFYTIAALNEELFFRGFMENELSKIVKASLIIPISALFFAANHFPNFGYLFDIFTAFNFINILLWGVIFSLCYRYSQNIWFPTIVHAGFNGLRMFIGTGDEKHSLFKITPGGEWAVQLGKYNSLIWISINVAVIGFLFYKQRRRSKPEPAGPSLKTCEIAGEANPYLIQK